jgi:hypothetical protein
VANLPTSQCHVFTEPHIVTFDQQRYDFYGTGTFLMVKNDVEQFEVRRGDHGSDFSDFFPAIFCYKTFPIFCFLSFLFSLNYLLTKLAELRSQHKT